MRETALGVQYSHRGAKARYATGPLRVQVSHNTVRLAFHYWMACSTAEKAATVADGYVQVNASKGTEEYL